MTARNQTAVLHPWMRRSSVKSRARAGRASHLKSGASRKIQILLRPPVGRAESPFLQRSGASRRTGNWLPKPDVKAAWHGDLPCAREQRVSSPRGISSNTNRRIWVTRKNKFLSSRTTVQFPATRRVTNRTAHANASAQCYERGGSPLPPRFHSQISA